MTNYYKLGFDDSNENVIVCKKVNLKGFNEYQLNNAVHIDTWPQGVTFYFDEGNSEDYLGNSMGWLLFSARIQKALLELGIKNIQFLPVKVENTKNGAKLEGFSVLNILDSITALDREHATYEQDKKNPEYPIIIKPALRYEHIRNIDIFRLREQPILVFVSQRIKEKLEVMQASGFKFISVPTF